MKHKFMFSDEFYNRLWDAINRAYSDLKSYREYYHDLKEIYAGNNYGKKKDDGSEKILRNKIRQMISIYSKRLAARNPQVTVNTECQAMLDHADDLQDAMKDWCKKNNFDSTLSTCVLDSIMCFGVMKTGVRQTRTGDHILDNIGEPFASAVNPNHFVMDVEAQTWETADFYGDRVQRDRKWIQKALRSVGQDEKADAIQEDVKASELKPEHRLSGVHEEDDRSLHRYGWVWDIYLREENVMLMLVEGVKHPIREIPWEGVSGGPYEMLGLFNVPHEIIPSSPAGDLLALHKQINALHDKLAEQAVRQKDVLAYEGDNAKDAENIVKAKDGDSVKVGKGVLASNRIKEISFGGADAVTSNTIIRAEQNFDTDAGNLLSLGGLGAQSETARQDELIASTSSAMLENMRKSVYRFTQKIMEKLGAYLYIDAAPRKVMKEVAGLSLEKVFVPSGEAEDFYRLNLDVVPHSMTEDTPNEELQKLLMSIERVVLPLAQFAQAEGLAPNVREIYRIWGKVTRIPMDRLLVSTNPDSPLQGKRPQHPGKPSFTHRINERVSRPGVTPYGNDQAMMAANAGAKPHGAAQAALA